MKFIEFTRASNGGKFTVNVDHIHLINPSVMARGYAIAGAEIKVGNQEHYVIERYEDIVAMLTGRVKE